MTEQMAHPTAEKLNAFSLGQLDADEAAAVESHVSDCQLCGETLIELSSEDTFVALLQEARLLPTDQTVDHRDNANAEPAPSCELLAPLKDHPRYEIQGLIGKGGMGDVFKARHRVMDRNVGLKVINCDLVRKPEAVARFHREVKTAAQLTHTNIVASYDAEQAGDLHFLVMEHIDGVDLSNLVKNDGPLAVYQACGFICQAAWGLQYAHDKGMVHRDIKPHNLMVTSDGVVKILDFGLASFAAESVGDREVAATDHPELTSIGAIMGTPDFISPEQARDARQADARSDIYSLGATLYFLLAGRPPLVNGNVINKLRSLASAEPEPLQNLRDDIPDGLASVVQRMMHKDVGERYQTAAEVTDALGPFLAPPELKQTERKPKAKESIRRPIASRPEVLIAAAGFIFMLIAATVFYIQLGKTTLKFEILDPTISVRFKDEAVEVDRGSGKTFIVAPNSEQQFTLLQDGIEVETDSLELSKGQKVTLKIEVVKGSIRITTNEEHVGLKRTPNAAARSEASAAYVVLVDADGKIVFESKEMAIASLEKRLDQLVPPNVRQASQIVVRAHSKAPKSVVAPLLTRLQALGFKEINVAMIPIRKTREVDGDSPSRESARGRSWFFEAMSRNEADNPPLFTIALSAAGSGVDAKVDGSFEFAASQPQPYWEHGMRIYLTADRDAVARYLAKLRDGLEASAHSYNVKLGDAAAGEFDGHLVGFTAGYSTNRLGGEFSGYLDAPESIKNSENTAWMIVLKVKEWSGKTRPAVVDGVNHPVLAQTYDGHTFGSDGKMAVSPNGLLLATFGNDVKIWDVASGKQKHVVPISESTVTSVVFVKDDLIAIGTSEVGHSKSSLGRVLLWNLITNQLQRELSDLAGAVYTLDISPDGKQLAVGAKFKDAGEALLWDLELLHKKSLGNNEPISRVKFTNDGKHIVTATAHQQGTVRLWEVATGKLIVTLDRVMNPRQIIQALAITPDSHQLLIAGGNWRERKAEVSRYDLSTMETRSKIGRKTSEFRAIAISPDGRRIALGAGDGQVFIVDTETTNDIARFTAYTKKPDDFDQIVSDLTFTNDGRSLLTIADGKSAKLWNLPACILAK